jgi:hypothetical protein
MTKSIGLTMVLLSIAGTAFAGTGVPEIDASTGTAALALLSGGMLILRTRRNRK